MTRQEHLAWAKQRALAYLPFDPVNAMVSMMSDLRKHDELKCHVGLTCAPVCYGVQNDPQLVQRWVEGFN